MTDQTLELFKHDQLIPVYLTGRSGCMCKNETSR